MKFLLLFLFLLLLWRFWGWQAARRRAARQRLAEETPRQDERILPCAACGTHVPESGGQQAGSRFFCAACAAPQGGDWLPDGWLAWARALPSPHFGARPEGMPVTLVVVHNISLPPGRFGGEWVEDFFLGRLDARAHPYFAEIAGLQVSAHLYVRRDGRVVQFVGCDQRAWHAGKSVWQGRENCNDFSVGIELEGCDDQPFEAAQYEALGELISVLRTRYPLTAVAGHSDIAPGRKTDPGPCFDWHRIRARCSGLDLPGA